MEDTMSPLQKDHLMILLESMDSKMQITVEAVGSLNDKIDSGDARLNARIDDMDSILKVAIDEVAKLHKKVDAVFEELVAHRNDTELHRGQTRRTLKNVKL
jgi:hypothetical protein